MSNKNLEHKQERDLWTQEEVAEYFRVVPSTVKNWRDRGLIKFWQAPGSSRVLYYRDDINDFRDKYTFNETGGINSCNNSNTKLKIKREKPVVSTNPEKEWKI